MAQESSVPRRRRLSRLERDATVHDDVLDAHGIAMWIVVGRRVRHLLGIEHDEVGPRADPYLAAIRETEMPRGERRHLAHRVLERHDALVTRVAPEDAGKGPVRARVRLSEGQRAIRRIRG